MSDRIDPPLLPPLLFVTNPMERPVMGGAEGDDPLVTDLPSHSSGLSEAQVMGMAR